MATFRLNMKLAWAMFLTVLLSGSLLAGGHAQAAETPKLQVELLSPDKVTDYPGIEMKIKARVTNLTDTAVPDVMAYITMANLTKHMTVNLEDYSADKPVIIGTLGPKAAKEVELPIRFVYPNRYHLYVTAVSSGSFGIQSSGAIPIEIKSNSAMDPTLVQTVTFAMPALMFGAMAVIGMMRRIKRNKAMPNLSNAEE
jgi:hypothetical protein